MLRNSFAILISIVGLIASLCLTVNAADGVFVNEKLNLPESFAKDAKTRTGEISPKELITRYEAFKNNYDDYTPSANDIENFSRLNNFDLVVFFGLWCHDSKREVPRLLKLIDLSKTRFRTVKLVAVNTRKILSEKYSSKYELSNTPTILVTKNNRVFARVVEEPKGTLAQDILGQIFR